MSKKILQLIKQASEEARTANKPVEFTSGTVASENPLIIITEQKLPLTSEFLTLTNAVKDQYADIEIAAVTEPTDNHIHKINTNTEASDGHSHKINSETEEAGSHSHNIKGTKKIKICNGLKKGEKVLLVKWQGGQRYIVIDRISDNICIGEEEL